MKLSRQKERVARLVIAFLLAIISLYSSHYCTFLVFSVLILLLLHFPNTSRIPVFAYHSINEQQDWSGAPDLVLSPSTFARQMQYLSKAGFNTITMEELQKNRKEKFIDKNAAVHFDDGYKDTMTKALPILESYGLKATVFVAPGILFDNIDLEHPLYRYKKQFLTEEDVCHVANSGVIEIQSHAWSHTPLTKLCKDERKKELIQSRQFLEHVTLQPVNHICFPKDDFSENVVAEVLECGYQSFTGGNTYNTHEDIEQVSRIYITSSANKTLDYLRFILEIRVYQGWYWLFPLLWIIQQYTKWSWKSFKSIPRLTP